MNKWVIKPKHELRHLFIQGITSRIPIFTKAPLMLTISCNMILSLILIPPSKYVVYYIGILFLKQICLLSGIQKKKCFKLTFVITPKETLLWYSAWCQGTHCFNSFQLWQFVFMSFLQKSIYLLLVTIWFSTLHYPLSLFDMDSWFLTLAIWPLSFLILRMYSFGFWPKLFSLTGTNEHFSQSRKKTLSHFYFSWNICIASPHFQSKENWEQNILTYLSSHK